MFLITGWIRTLQGHGSWYCCFFVVMGLVCNLQTSCLHFIMRLSFLTVLCWNLMNLLPFTDCISGEGSVNFHWLKIMEPCCGFKKCFRCFLSQSKCLFVRNWVHDFHMNEFELFTFDKVPRKMRYWNSWILWLPFWPFQPGNSSSDCRKFLLPACCSKGWKLLLYHPLLLNYCFAYLFLLEIPRAHRWLKWTCCCCFRKFSHGFCTCFVPLWLFLHSRRETSQFKAFIVGFFQQVMANYQKGFWSSSAIWEKFILIFFIQSS